MIADISTIVARRMGIRRGGRWILRPTAFAIGEGVVGFAGPPGVGKSSLLATFATLRRPRVGVLEVLGHDTRDPAALRFVRARLGYLPEDLRWAEGFSVGDFVSYAAYYKRVPQDAVRAALDRLEIRDVAAMELGLLPPDVRLRAGIAATCVQEPELVLLDEPLTGLDDRAATDLLAVLRSLAPTVVVTASHAEELTGWCDRVLTLSRGRLTELPVRPYPGPASPHRRHARSGEPPAAARRNAAMESLRNDRDPVGSGARV